MMKKQTFLKLLSWAPYVTAFSLLLILFYSESLQKFGDKAFILSLLGLVLVMVFALQFEHVSLFKILELKKRVTEEKVAREKIEEKNHDLTKHLVSLSLSLKQTQSNITLNTPIDGITLQNLLGVTRADEQEIETQKAEEEPQTIGRAEVSDYRSRIDERKRKEEEIISEKLRDKIFAQKEVKFTSAMDFIDPIITNRSIIFDGFYIDNGSEVFVEVIPNRSMGGMFIDRLYMQLNHIYLYNKAANKNACLELVVYQQDDPTSNDQIHRRNTIEVINRFFEPAIKSGLLKVQRYTSNNG